MFWLLIGLVIGCVVFQLQFVKGIWQKFLNFFK